MIFFSLIYLVGNGREQHGFLCKASGVNSSCNEYLHLPTLMTSVQGIEETELISKRQNFGLLKVK